MHAPNGSVVRRLGALHPDAGYRSFRRNTSAIASFEFTGADGSTVHSTRHEAHEQFVVGRMLQPTDCVLELGGGVGAVSLAIQRLLRTPTDHVVVEPQAALCTMLEVNRAMHSGLFKVAHGAIATGPVICSQADGAIDGPDSRSGRQWMYNTTADVQPGAGCGREVPSLNPTALQRLVSRPFTVLVADCEGALPQVVEEFPAVLDGLRAIYFEADPPATADAYRRLEATLVRHGFVNTLRASLHRVFERRDSAAAATPPAATANSTAAARATPCPSICVVLRVPLPLKPPLERRFLGCKRCRFSQLGCGPSKRSPKTLGCRGRACGKSGDDDGGIVGVATMETMEDDNGNGHSSEDSATPRPEWGCVDSKLAAKLANWTSYAHAHALATRAVASLLCEPLDLEEFLQAHNCALYTGEHAEPEVRAHLYTLPGGPGAFARRCVTVVRLTDAEGGGYRAFNSFKALCAFTGRISGDWKYGIKCWSYTTYPMICI